MLPGRPPVSPHPAPFPWEAVKCNQLDDRCRASTRRRAAVTVARRLAFKNPARHVYRKFGSLRREEGKDS